MLNADDIAKIFEWIEMLLIGSLKRNLTRHEAEEKKYGFNWSAWQAEKLRNLDKFRRENAAIVGKYTNTIDKNTRALLEEQFREGVNGAAQEAGEAPQSQPVYMQKIVQPQEQPTPETTEQVSTEPPTATDEPIAVIKPEPQFFGVDTVKVNKLVEDMTTMEKQAEMAALRLTDDVYRQTVNRVQLAMSTGSMTLNKAIDTAVEDFLNAGINCIEYKDGRRVNIADYVRMALRTTSTRAALQGKSEKYKDLGYDTVIVSSYGMCSQTCLPYQGRVYINDAFTSWVGETEQRADGLTYGKSNYCGKWFPLLSSAIKGGLFHPNCRHSINLWRDGDPLPETLDNSQTERRYKLEQQQRALEREIRRAKRRVEGFTDPEDIAMAEAQLKDKQKQLREFIDKTNADEGTEVLRRDSSKEKVYEGEVPKAAESNRKPERYESLSPSPETKPDAPQATQEDNEGNSSPEQDNAVQSSTEGKENVNNTSLDNSDVNGKIKVEADEYVPCLKEAETGKIVETEVRKVVDKTILSECTEKNGWDFPWNTPPDDCDVYSLNVKGKDEIEGLIALRPDERAWGVYMFWGNAAPHNMGQKKKYVGVGGHLFAIAAKVSLENGYGGYIFGDAANEELYKMFITKYGATPYGSRNRPYRFAIENEALVDILNTYSFDWEE